MGTQTHIYTLRMSMAGCRYDVRVNDVPVFRDMIDGMPMTATMAVNEYLRPGRNLLSVHLVPSGERTEIEAPAETLDVAILGRPRGTPKTEDRPLVTLRLRPGTTEGAAATVETVATPLLSAPPSAAVQGDRTHALAASLPFDLPEPSFAWKWLSSQPIPDTPATLAELRALFADWIARLERRDAGWVAPALAERTEELSQALFEPRAAVERHGLFDAVADPGLTLYDPELEHSRLLVFGDGRLAQLLRWDETPILCHLHADGQNANYYPLTLRRSGAQWLVCR